VLKLIHHGVVNCLTIIIKQSWVTL